MIILVLSLLAAWLAAGSLGWLAPPLQKTLTWLAIAAIVIVAIAGSRRISPNNSLLLGGATSIAVLLTASSLPVVNILAVAILLAAIAQVRTGLIAWVAGSVALAATALAVFRLVCDGSATAWTFTNSVGHIEGLWAGWLTRRPLLIGASFGGLDFLVLMSALTAAWLIATPRPRSGRAAWAILFIVLAQTAYLVVLAFHQDLIARLPQSTPKYDDISHLGIWTWGNAIRTLLPWNLPLLAGVFQCIVAVGMFGLTAWQATSHDLQGETGKDFSATEGKRRNRSLQGGPALPQRNSWMNLRPFGPAGLLIVAEAAMTFSPVRPDLEGRRIVAYDDGATDWTTADPGAVPPGVLPRYGLLPVLVQSLGGEFIRSRDLADADLQGADVLIVLPPGSAANAAAVKASIPSDIRDQIGKYVSAGGRLIVAGEPETNLGVKDNVLNSLLDSTAMSIRDDTANSLTERWEDNLQSAPHAATASSNPGRNQFSLDRAASIRVSWPAGPLVVGRWAWDELGTDPERPESLSYTPGNHLGDLVLAAQQNVGRGTVVVLGAAACLSNDGIPFSYTFIGPLLSALAANHPAPLVWWRQLLGVMAAGAAIVLLFRRFEPLRVAAAGIALALAVIACSLLNNASAELLPAGTKTAAQPIVYVDGSHLEAMGKDPWGENGIGRLMRVLADSNCLPLVAPDLSPDRLKQAAMLVSIAPARAFSSGEIAAVSEFVADGGFFLSTVGSPEAEPSRALLENFDLHVQPMPVPPWVDARETTPLGWFRYPNAELGQPIAEFYAAWPVSGAPGAETWSKPVIVGTVVQRGRAYLIGDTAFALNKNFDSSSPNATFWRSQLKVWLGHSAGKPVTVEPAEGGIISLPKPKG
ncbi:MAG: hypothetical protein ACLP9L_04925 [Thermoguttaceae bacterium]